MTKKQQREIAEQKAEAIAMLKQWLAPGSTVYTVLRHVSKSGMSRLVDVYAVVDGEMRYLTKLVSKATASETSGYLFPVKYGKHDALEVSGCGMDVGFEIVYTLGRSLWPEGFHTSLVENPYYPRTEEQWAALVEAGRVFQAGSYYCCALCGSDPHSALLVEHCQGVDRTRNGDRSGWDSDGGYSLRHQWL